MTWVCLVGGDRYLMDLIGVGGDRYLCKHHSPWYAQEKRPPSPFLCTYMGRQDTGKGRPFRFILNHSRATATNVYLMLYPQPALAKVLLDQPELLKEVWQALNRISDEALMGEGGVEKDECLDVLLTLK